ncbi:MAG: response regulator [Kurthia sp.]|nr:response regulator [Candidatus Kurthia equi]
MTIQLLLVEDEIIVRNSVQKMIATNREHLAVHVAADVFEARKIMQQQAIHLLLLDIQLPEIDGLSYLKALREKNPHMLVIILSAHTEFEYAQQAIDLGVIKYLVKPISKAKLLEAIDHCLTKITLPETTDHHASIEFALSYIKENYNQALTLQELADLVHLNTSYFSTLFKQSVGVNFSQYITSFRMKEAKKLLLTNKYSIEEISFRVGYQSSKYFIQIFKEYEKITPKQYQKNSISKDVGISSK